MVSAPAFRKNPRFQFWGGKERNGTSLLFLLTVLFLTESPTFKKTGVQWCFFFSLPYPKIIRYS